MSLRPFKMHNKANNLRNARQILPMWKVKSMEISMKKLTTTHVMYRIFTEWRPSKFCVLRLDVREQRGVGSRDRLHSRHPHLRYNIFKSTWRPQMSSHMHTSHNSDSHPSTLEVFIKTKTHRKIILSYSLPRLTLTFDILKSTWGPQISFLNPINLCTLFTILILTPQHQRCS